MRECGRGPYRMNAAARGGREVQRHIINRGEGERRGEGVGVVNEWRSE